MKTVEARANNGLGIIIVRCRRACDRQNIMNKGLRTYQSRWNKQYGREIERRREYGIRTVYPLRVVYFMRGGWLGHVRESHTSPYPSPRVTASRAFSAHGDPRQIATPMIFIRWAIIRSLRGINHYPSNIEFIYTDRTRVFSVNTAAIQGYFRQKEKDKVDTILLQQNHLGSLSSQSVSYEDLQQVNWHGRSVSKSGVLKFNCELTCDHDKTVASTTVGLKRNYSDTRCERMPTIHACLVGKLYTWVNIACLMDSLIWRRSNGLVPIWHLWPRGRRSRTNIVDAFSR